MKKDRKKKEFVKEEKKKLFLFVHAGLMGPYCRFDTADRQVCPSLAGDAIDPTPFLSIPLDENDLSLQPLVSRIRKAQEVDTRKSAEELINLGALAALCFVAGAESERSQPRSA